VIIKLKDSFKFLYILRSFLFLSPVTSLSHDTFDLSLFDLVPLYSRNGRRIPVTLLSDDSFHWSIFNLVPLYDQWKESSDNKVTGILQPFLEYKGTRSNNDKSNVSCDNEVTGDRNKNDRKIYRNLKESLSC
jgi:hypothetical protein